MALPKEPRQKMINLMYLVLTALLAMNVSSEILNAFKVVDSSLKTSNANLSAGNKTIYESLAEKVSDPKTAEKARIWEPKAQAAKKLSDDMNNFIESLKKDLLNASGLKKEMIDGKETEVFKEDDLDAASRLFDTEGKGKVFEAKLLAYRKAMLDIDPDIKAKFEKTLPIDVTPPVAQDGSKKEFTQAYFHMTPTVAALTLLSKFQNNVKNAENQVVSFCHEQIGAVKVKFDKTDVLVGQSSNYVMPGEEIEITAGVGAYSSAAQPKISINGSAATVTDGKGVYKFAANGAGAHKVPVTVTYLDQDGVQQTKTQEVEYTVGTPGGAAASADKMNVFYIGVDNPLTVGSPTGWEKTKVTASNAQLSGTNGKYIIRVTTGTEAFINVNADNKNSQFKFRVKRIPDPIFKVGPSAGGAIQAAVFKAQQYCRAELENFDFEARFSVVSATVYFTGAGFPVPQPFSLTGNNIGSIPQMAKCQPGTTVIFDNVKVQGPDGVVRPIQAPGFLLK